MQINANGPARARIQSKNYSTLARYSTVHTVQGAWCIERIAFLISSPAAYISFVIRIYGDNEATKPADDSLMRIRGGRQKRAYSRPARISRRISRYCQYRIPPFDSRLRPLSGWHLSCSLATFTPTKGLRTSMSFDHRCPNEAE